LNKKGIFKFGAFIGAILALILFLIFYITPIFAVPFSSSVTPNSTNVSISNQLFNFTVNNTNSSENITQVNITLPTNFNFIGNSNSTTASDTSFSNTTQLLTWDNTTAIGFITNDTAQYFSFNTSVTSTAGAYNFTVNTTDTSGTSNESNVSISVYGFANLSCPLLDQYPSYLYSAVGGSYRIDCFVQDNNTGQPVPDYVVNLYNATALVGSNTTQSDGWANITFTTPVQTSYTLVANISDNTSIFYYNTTPYTANKTMFVSSATNPRPVIQSSNDVSLSYETFAQYRPNYSFPLPFIVPNFTNGTFNGMITPTNIYGPLTYMSDMFFQHPTRIETMAYNLTFNASSTTTNNSRLINITIPIPWNQTACIVDSICNPFNQYPLYKNQSILPAKFETMQEPAFMNDMNQSYVPQEMTILMKNPESFVVNVTNSSGYTYVVNGTQLFGPAPNATFTQGKIVLNLTNIDAEGPYRIFVLLGIQDMTCFDQVEAAPGNFSNHTNFMLYCEQHSDPNDPLSPPAGPPKFESSPAYITYQSITGFNPFEGDKGDAELINTTQSMTFITNITNPLLNYTGDNISAEFRYPLNVTFWNTTWNSQVTESFNVSENHTVGFWNRTVAIWSTIDPTTTPYINTTEGCMDITDDMPGSPMNGKNMTMCYRTILFNLNQTVSYDTGGLANAWVYNASVRLNISVSMGFKILNQTNYTSGTTMGEAGSTNQYNMTVAGGQSTGGGTGGTSSGAQSNAGVFKLDSTLLPGLDSVVCANPPNCGNITVTVNGQTYSNWTTGSPIIITSQSSGVQSISISYSVPSAAAADGVITTLTISSFIPPEETKETHGLGEIKAGESGTITFEEAELAITETIISVVNTVKDITLKLIKLTDKPATIGVDVPGKIYVYLNMQTQNIQDEDVSSVKIKFKVTKSWVTTNNIDVSTVALNRWANDQWNELPTSKVSEDTDYYHFEATSPSLSYFAVNGEEAAAPCVENWSCTDWSVCVEGIQTRTCTDLNDCGTNVNKPVESQSCEVGVAEVLVGWPIWSYAVIVVVIVVVIVLVYTQRKKIFPKKKPSKEKKTEYYYSESKK